MDLIDTHCHLTFGPLAGDVDAVVQRSRRAGVTSWVTVGTDADHNRAVVELAGRLDNLYAAVGLHPHDAKEVTGEVITELRQLAGRERVVALGEMGLDYHYDHSPRPVQRRVFVQQLHLARELYLPVIIHSRNAFDETLEILDEFGDGLKGVVFHCFGGDAEQAGVLVQRGYYVSFTGVVTFKNAETARQAALAVPLERLMLETDCPYMSPEPLRRQKVNEPALMVHTARFLAQLKAVEFESFAEAVSATSRSFFDIPAPADRR